MQQITEKAVALEPVTLARDAWPLCACATQQYQGEILHETANLRREDAQQNRHSLTQSHAQV